MPGNDRTDVTAIHVDVMKVREIHVPRPPCILPSNFAWDGTAKHKPCPGIESIDVELFEPTALKRSQIEDCNPYIRAGIRNEFSALPPRILNIDVGVLGDAW